MTDILTLPAMRAAFCISCALPTGELYEEGSAPTMSFCNDCENLPNPWSCDRDGNTEIGTIRRNQQRDGGDPLTDGWEVQRRRERLGIRVPTPRAQPRDHLQQLVAPGQEARVPIHRDERGRFAPAPAGNLYWTATTVPIEEPEAPAVPTCECGSTRFRARIIEHRRTRAYGDSPVYDCAENEPGDMVVGVECYIDEFDGDEFDGDAPIDTDDSNVDHVYCHDCGTPWTGEWELI